MKVHYFYNVLWDASFFLSSFSFHYPTVLLFAFAVFLAPREVLYAVLSIFLKEP
jgi:hypothetical protein